VTDVIFERGRYAVRMRTYGIFDEHEAFDVRRKVTGGWQEVKSYRNRQDAITAAKRAAAHEAQCQLKL
jgi:hypothetical protein